MLYGANLSGVKGGGQASCSLASEGLAAAAETAAGTAKDEDKKILSKRGRASFELKTNMLIINDTAKKIQEVRELLAKIDVPARQVLIEARVVIADNTWSRDLGAKLGLVGMNQNKRYQTGIGGNQNEATSTAQGFVPQLPTRGTRQFRDAVTGELREESVVLQGPGTNMVNFPAGGNAAQFALSLLDAATGNMLSLELSALEVDNRGKVISNPRVVTTNQKPAVILQGVQIPYTSADTSGSAAANTTIFKDAFLCLLVDPQILNNDSVILNVEVQKDAPGQNGAIDRRRVKTLVRVNNGETVVLGGIYETVNRKDIDKVPFLGDLPFLGNLFKKTGRQEIKTELMIFLTPRLIDERLSLR